MRIRIAYGKLRTQIDSDIQEFGKQLNETTLKGVGDFNTMTDEEKAIAEQTVKKANAEYEEFVKQKGLEAIESSVDDKFTEEEYEEIVEVNAGNDVELNGTKVSAADLLEIFYNLFIHE